MNKLPLITTIALALALTACDNAPVPNSNSQTAMPAAEIEAQQYTCPMHPHYISSDPDGICPICGMDLVPVAQDAGEAPSAGGIAVSPEMIQTMGVRIASVEQATFGKSLRAFGTVETNERLENASVSRLEGWIEDLRVRADGDIVNKGALLYQIYSPDLISAQKDYINSLAIGNEKRIASVRQRLRSLGMQNTTIDRLTETKNTIERVPVYAEASGIVSNLQVREGDYVKPGTAIMRLQSYDAVWIIARLPESDLPFIRAGMPVSLDFPSAPDAVSKGRVDYIYPTIDPSTRTGEVRIEVENADGRLRPGAYADISVSLDLASRLAIPTEAVLKDSRGSHVIVSLGEGRFAGRLIKTGIAIDGRTEVLEGLELGEQVVASGQFMLDSEVNLREGLSKLKAPTMSNFGPDTPLSYFSANPQLMAEMDHIVDMALYLHEALVDGYKIDPYFLDPAIKAAQDAASRFTDTQLVPVVNGANDSLVRAKDAGDEASLASALIELMRALDPWLIEGAPSHYQDVGLVLFRDEGSHRLWVQEGARARNPYRKDGSAIIIDWPEKPQAPATSVDRPKSSDPHAGHR